MQGRARGLHGPRGDWLGAGCWVHGEGGGDGSLERTAWQSGDLRTGLGVMKIGRQLMGFGGVTALGCGWQGRNWWRL